MFACIHASNAGLIASLFSPEWEIDGEEAVFDAAPLRHLYGGPRRIAEEIARETEGAASIAIASNPDAALLAARNFSGITVIDGAAASELASLPVDALALDEKLIETFDRWGIRTLGDLAALPADGLAARFGQQAAYWRHLARGEASRPLRVHQPDPIYEDRIELDHPIELIEPLLFVIARMLNDQCEKLQSHGMAANAVWIQLDLEPSPDHRRALRLPFPIRESKTLLKLLQMDLESHPPQAAILAVSLGLSPVPPRRVQNGLFFPLAPAPDKLELTLARIRRLVGEENVGVPELLNTHRPEPFRLSPITQPLLPAPRIASVPEPRLAFRFYRPALAARVEALNHRPVKLSAAGFSGKIVTAAGPWRTSGDWWPRESWNRDEWDIALGNGALYRIYREPGGSWFVEGSYD